MTCLGPVGAVLGGVLVEENGGGKCAVNVGCCWEVRVDRVDGLGL